MYKLMWRNRMVQPTREIWSEAQCCKLGIPSMRRGVQPTAWRYLGDFHKIGWLWASQRLWPTWPLSMKTGLCCRSCCVLFRELGGSRRSVHKHIVCRIIQASRQQCNLVTLKSHVQSISIASTTWWFWASDPRSILHAHLHAHLICAITPLPS